MELLTFDKPLILVMIRVEIVDGENNIRVNIGTFYFKHLTISYSGNWFPRQKFRERSPQPPCPCEAKDV